MNPRVVLDTNVVVSALLFNGPPRVIIRHVTLGNLTAITSPMLLAELEEVLLKKFDFAPDLAQAATEKYARACKVVRPSQTISVLSDGPDNRVLEAATTGRAEFVVTGDKLFLKQQSYRGCRIIPPKEMLDQLG